MHTTDCRVFFSRNRESVLWSRWNSEWRIWWANKNGPKNSSTSFCYVIVSTARLVMLHGTHLAAYSLCLRNARLTSNRNSRSENCPKKERNKTKTYMQKPNRAHISHLITVDRRTSWRHGKGPLSLFLNMVCLATDSHLCVFGVFLFLNISSEIATSEDRRYIYIGITSLKWRT